MPSGAGHSKSSYTPPPCRPLAITMGDAAGIGPDITLAAWHARSRHSLRPFVVFGDPDVISARAERLGQPVKVVEVGSCGQAIEVFENGLPVSSVAAAAPVVAGQPDSANAPATIAAIDAAVAAVASGEAAGVVTNPIAKAVLYEAGFRDPGHTEYLERLAKRFWPDLICQSVMMLVSPSLRIVPLTIHVPLSDVPGLITQNRIADTVRAMVTSLVREFGIQTPRIAVCGLNPHAGEDGALGREELDIIAPAIATLKAESIDLTGPHSADTLFHDRARTGYDAVLAMYHDQALIPIKTLDFDSGVNATIGLPFVRTSPDYGTAFSIAGSGEARADSLISALKLADDMARRRA